MCQQTKSNIIVIKAKTARLAEYIEAGRVGLYAIELRANQFILAYVIYGWTGAHQNKDAASWTNELLDAIFVDQTYQTDGPMFTIGDLNGDPVDFINLHDQIKRFQQFDLGAMTEFTDEVNQPTCRAPNAKVENRRDYFICNVHGFPCNC